MGYMLALIAIVVSPMSFSMKLINMILLAAAVIITLFCFAKMDINPWAALIPFYDAYCLYECIWGVGWLALLSWATFITSLFNPILALIINIIAKIMEIVTSWRMFKGFGKNALFCIFGIFFSPIAMAICAFDDSHFSC